MLSAQTDIAEEERSRLMDELKTKADDMERQKSKQQKMMKRITNMQEKLIQGNVAVEKAMEQE